MSRLILSSKRIYITKMHTIIVLNVLHVDSKCRTGKMGNGLKLKTDQRMQKIWFESCWSMKAVPRERAARICETK